MCVLCIDYSDDDDDEEGVGGITNFLTREERKTMSATEKATWRAKQGDLTRRRNGE